MSYHKLLAKDRNLPQFTNPQVRGSSLPLQRLMQPSSNRNIIKLNQNKLPYDFFPPAITARRTRPLAKVEAGSNQMFFLEKKMNLRKTRNTSDRSKAFVFFNQNQQTREKQIKVANRKFETRDQPKREGVGYDFRKYTPSTNNNRRNQFLDLQMHPSQNLRAGKNLTARKEIGKLAVQASITTQNQNLMNFTFCNERPVSLPKISLKNLSYS